MFCGLALDMLLSSRKTGKFNFDTCYMFNNLHVYNLFSAEYTYDMTKLFQMIQVKRPPLLDGLPYAAFGPTEIDSEISGGYPNKDLATCKYMPNVLEMLEIPTVYTSFDMFCTAMDKAVAFGKCGFGKM